jgi:hypothetical protein
VAGSQPMSTAVHRSPNKHCRSSYILTYGIKLRYKAQFLSWLNPKTEVFTLNLAPSPTHPPRNFVDRIKPIFILSSPQLEEQLISEFCSPTIMECSIA